MRKLLLDSHTLIWFLEGDARLPSRVKALIEEGENSISVSIVSFWEIAIKRSLSKLTLNRTLSEIFKECEIQ